MEGYLSGERNYKNIRGDTGPLVYPAGFLYIFSMLRSLTDDGINIFKGQMIFTGIYLLNLLVVFGLHYEHNDIHHNELENGRFEGNQTSRTSVDQVG